MNKEKIEREVASYPQLYLYNFKGEKLRIYGTPDKDNRISEKTVIIEENEDQEDAYVAFVKKDVLFAKPCRSIVHNNYQTYVFYRGLLNLEKVKTVFFASEDDGLCYKVPFLVFKDSTYNIDSATSPTSKIYIRRQSVIPFVINKNHLRNFK